MSNQKRMVLYSLLLTIVLSGSKSPNQVYASTPTIGVGTALIPKIGKNQDRIGHHELSIDGEDSPHHLIGVYDGHGVHGNLLAELARDSIPTYFQESLIESGGDIVAALVQALAKTENKIAQNETIANSGTTAASLFLYDNRVFITNIGDSRVVISHNGNAFQPIDDHGLNSRKEVLRIKKTGCLPTFQCHAHNIFLNNKPCCPQASSHCRIYGRVGGCRFTRSLGDIQTKKELNKSYGAPIILAEPEAWFSKLIPTDEFIILASDGVWDDIVENPISNQEAADVVREVLSLYPTRAHGAKESALALANLAKQRVAFDDIAVVVITLDWPDTGTQFSNS